MFVFYFQQQILSHQLNNYFRFYLFGPEMKALILAKSATMTEMSSPDASSPFFFSQYKSGTFSPLKMFKHFGFCF